jgi:hypothetical protein
MRVKLIALVIALVVACGLLIENGSSASPRRLHADQRLTVSPHGTLLELFETGLPSQARRVGGDGFTLRYTTRGTTRSVFAREMSKSGLRLSFEPVIVDGNTATAVRRTADLSLEITSQYTFDHNTKMLTINRKFRNISKRRVTLQTLRNYIDPTLVFGAQANHIEKKLEPASPVRAGLTANLSCFSKCIPPPVCPWEEPPRCPRDLVYFKARWDGSSPRDTILRWSSPITLMPKTTNSPAQEAFMVVQVVIR